VANPADATQTKEIPEKPVGTFTSLRLRDFRLLFIGTILSNAGLWLQQVALNWLVYDITGSGTILGTLNIVRRLPHSAWRRPQALSLTVSTTAS